MRNLEFETKILNINVEEAESKLANIGASKVGELKSRRKVFDMKSEDIKWVRVRQEGEKTTLTYKFKPLNNATIGLTEEIEVVVNDFNKTCELISKLGFFYRTMYQENKVIIYEKGNVEYKIAIWPLIDPYLEIESSSVENVQEALKELGLEEKDSGDFDIAKIYELKGIDMNSVEELKF